MKDYSELKRIAISAGAGEWTLVIHDDCEYIDGSNGEFIAAFDEPEHGEFIASANPAQVLELIAEVEILKYDCQVANSCVNAAKKECKSIFHKNESLKKDADRYRWITDGSRGDYCWNNVLSEKDRDGGDTLDDAIDKAMRNKE